jgi:hypothetical protein
MLCSIRNIHKIYSADQIKKNETGSARSLYNREEIYMQVSGRYT